jgi:type VI secretion system protein ImpA
MMSIDFCERLSEPLSVEDPCGPDLDLVGDADFLNFMAMAEGLLPKTFFMRNPKEPDSDSKPFNVNDEARGGFDVGAQLKAIANFGERTRDLRLITLAAKFTILNRDISVFVEFVQAIANLLETRWEDVNPKGEDNDFTMRIVAIQSLDDNAPVVFPLMFAPLFEDRRFGPVSFRTWLLVSEEVSPRDEDEKKLDLAQARRAFEEVAIETLLSRRAQFQNLNESIERICHVLTEQVGYEQAVTFRQLTPVSQKIFALLDAAIAKRDPNLGSAGQDISASLETTDRAADHASASLSSSSVANGPITSFADAAAALAAVADYYRRKEPSNPALLLVRQAKDLIGKPFLEVLRILLPRHIDEAVMKIGRTHTFDLPVERLAEFSSASGLEEETERTFEVTTREQVLQLLSQVTSFFQNAEPTSPIPLLLERARAMAARDFISLLREILPEDTLKGLNS